MATTTSMTEREASRMASDLVAKYRLRVGMTVCHGGADVRLHTLPYATHEGDGTYAVRADMEAIGGPRAGHRYYGDCSGSMLHVPRS